MSSSFDQHYNLFMLDDSPEDREIYKRRLSKIPGVEFDITETGNIDQAKQMTLGRHFDCYIIDYNLPNSNGLEFIKYLQENRREYTKAAALIVVTGQGSEDIASEAFKLGAHEYLTKKSLSEAASFNRPLMNAIERAQLTTQLQSYRDQLQRSHRDLSEFTHMAAHDLKSPLRRILSYCEILEEDAAERLNNEDKSILSRMSLNAKRMRELIDSLLAYSLVNANDEGKQEVDLREMVHDIVSEFQHQLEEDGGKISVDFLPRVSVFPIRMRQLLTNLISNARKYKSERPLHIEITASQEDDNLIIAVKDNGLGIDAAQCDEIFKDFKRLHPNEEIEGTGLGLSICKKIAQRHGGDIWVESEPGVGSTFYFTIKLDSP